MIKCLATLACVAGIFWGAAQVVGAEPATQAGGAGGVENWPRFRGPTGMGITTEKNLPETWGGPGGGADGKNVLWKTPLVGEGHASPIVWGNFVFVCNVKGPVKAEEIPEHHVACYQASDGKMLWDTVVPPGQWKRSDFRSGPGGGYAVPTPTTDGKRVYCVFGSSVIAALDFEGKIVWRKEIEPHSFDVCVGASPILFGETVLMVETMAKKIDSKIVAYDPATGNGKWETKLIDTGFGHSTPLLIDVAGKPQLLISAGSMDEIDNALQAVDPTNGERLWWCKGYGESSSPVAFDGLVYFDSGRRGTGKVVDPTGKGDVSATNVKYEFNVGDALSSPVVFNKLIYRLVSPGVFKCWDTTTGKPVYAEKLEKPSSLWASPVIDPNGRIFLATGGKSFVIQAGREFKLLAMNDLGDGSHPSPAVAGGRMFLVGLRNIYCVGNGK